MLSRSFFAAAALVAAMAPAFADTVIPLEFGPRPTTMVSVGGNPPVKMIFDTGAMGMVFDVALARQYGLPELQPVRVGSPGGATPREGFLTAIPSLTVGNGTFQNVRAVAMEPLNVQGERGVLSAAVFAGSLVRFEFSRSRVVVTPKDAAHLPSDSATPYIGEDAHRVLPALQVSIAGQPIMAHLDSGSGYALTMPLAIVKTLKLKTPLVPRAPVHMTGGDLTAYTAQLDGTVTVGSISVKDPEILVVDGFPFVNVGIQLLSKLTLVLDPEEHRSWVLPADPA